MVQRRTLIKGLAVAPIAGSALFALPGRGLAQDTIVIGSKNFTEQLILGELYAQRLKALGMPVTTSLNLGGTAVAHEALVAGELSLYPEYTGTALTVILEIPIASVAATPEADAADAPSIDDLVFQLVADGYKEQFDLVWLDQTPFNNTQALAVKRAFSEENGVTTISQLADIAGDLTIVAPSDFVERPDGLQGLQDFYGLEFGDVLSVEPGIRYQALQEDQAQVVLAFGTDGQVAGYDLVLLEDDLGLWPPYHVAPVVRQDVLDAFPDLAPALNEIAPLLTDQVMAELNWRVDGDAKEEPAEVAQSLLEENGLLGE
jgi:osmoprotectant transport system substrate-binding protein